MAAPWGILALVIGVLYGALKQGRQDKGHLIRQGLFIGLVVGLVLGILGFLLRAPALGISGFVGAVVAALVITVLFVLGVWIGDLLTERRRGTA